MSDDEDYNNNIKEEEEEEEENEENEEGREETGEDEGREKGEEEGQEKTDEENENKEESNQEDENTQPESPKLELSPLWKTVKNIEEEEDLTKKEELIENLNNLISNKTGEDEEKEEGEEEEGDDVEKDSNYLKYANEASKIWKDGKEYRCLLHWTTEHGIEKIAETLIKNKGREICGFQNEKDLEIFDKWVEEKKAAAEKEEEEEEEGEEGDDDEEEEGESKPELHDNIAEELEVPVTKVKGIMEMGVFDGNRDEDENKQGSGSTLFVNGDIFVGSYENNQRNGKGIYIHFSKRNQDGIIPFYLGEWDHSKRQGCGFQKFEDNSSYNGFWKNGMRHGKGKMNYYNGDIYDGEWKANIRHGQGKYTFKHDGSQFDGEWNEGGFVKGKWIMANGIIYEGKLKNGKGRGQFKCKNTVLKGRYDHNQWKLEKIEQYSQ
eukprot:gb/GECH01011905.1/.p1 GENE.gb/GECH01011905.1/~~gb/GECH01011905.1/.p1  ORF type:complete len:435 (+),score=179.97 gb/GECH01011905.1/:1-1305(+)